MNAEGHYKTSFEISLGDKETAKAEGRWSLQNAVLVLKATRNPIPMYSKRIEIEIPEQDKPIGFDFEKGDWVAPYGRGDIVDFSIIFSNQHEGIQHYWKRLIFCMTNPLEGITVQKRDDFSEFVSDYNAPEEGYQPEYRFERKRTKTEIIIDKTNKEDEYFVLRSRVVTNAEGAVISANISKIYGPIEYAVGREKNLLKFTYYFNPDGTQNLEFDPQRNLFKDLSVSEKVTAP